MFDIIFDIFILFFIILLNLPNTLETKHLDVIPNSITNLLINCITKTSKFTSNAYLW